MPFDLIDIGAKGEQEWRGWIAAACARLSAERLTPSFEQKLGREAVSELIQIPPHTKAPFTRRASRSAPVGRGARLGHVSAIERLRAAREFLAGP